MFSPGIIVKKHENQGYINQVLGLLVMGQVFGRQVCHVSLVVKAPESKRNGLQRRRFESCITRLENFPPGIPTIVLKRPIIGLNLFL